MGFGQAWKLNQTLFGKILVATDGSENARRAGETAIDLAKKYNAELVVINVIPPLQSFEVGTTMIPPSVMDQYYKDARAEAMKATEQVVSAAKKAGVVAKSELLDKPTAVVEAITNYARKENVDLIVLGTRGLGGFKKLLIGSVSSGVVGHAPCSVLIVR